MMGDDEVLDGKLMCGCIDCTIEALMNDEVLPDSYVVIGGLTMPLQVLPLLFGSRAGFFRPGYWGTYYPDDSLAESCLMLQQTCSDGEEESGMNPLALGQQNTRPWAYAHAGDDVALERRTHRVLSFAVDKPDWRQWQEHPRGPRKTDKTGSPRVKGGRFSG